jgi:Galactose oxidase, central domain
MKAWTGWTLLAMLGVILAGETARGGELPMNKWVLVGGGDIELARGYPDLVGCKMVWVAHLKCFVVAPQFALEESSYRLFSTAESKWVKKPGSAPKGRVPDRLTSPRAYCYLPGLKKVLFLKEQWSHSRNRKPASGWLMDPADGKWEPLDGIVRMGESSADFNAGPCGDGMRLPVWGQLIYDAHNQEAVVVGGGGVWGRVGKQQEPVVPGDWIYDEKAKRCRRLTGDDAGKVTAARKWYPAQCGTWVFPESEKKWKPIGQPMRGQPRGRILPGAAYDAGEQKIVLFGGDDLSRCLDDTWVYDCKTRTWKEVKPPVRPQARAGHAMVYVPEAKAIVLAGGYTGGWRELSDVWVYRTAQNKWERLGLDLPGKMCYASGAYVPEKKTLFLACYPQRRFNKKVPVYALRLGLASAPRVSPEKTRPQSAYHSPAHYDYPMPLPDEWLKGSNKPGDPGAGRKELAGLPANTWVKREPPVKAWKRAWGSYVYDVRTHRGYAWGGGHCQNSSPDIAEYDMLTNRWRMMADPANYAPVWRHRHAGGSPGVSFGGWTLLPSHARKSYGVDPSSDSVVSYDGNIYSTKHHRFVGRMGKFPTRWGGVSHQMAYVTTPHGLYAYATQNVKTGYLCKANVKKGAWEVVAKGGPVRHSEYNHLSYDSKRDQLLYFRSSSGPAQIDKDMIWSFAFKTSTWREEKPAGASPARMLGDSTYVPELDAVLMIFGKTRKGQEKLYFYKPGERKWYVAACKGDRPSAANYTGRDLSPIYDPELKLVVRLTCDAHQKHSRTEVFVMRLDAKNLKLTPLE